MVYSVGDTRVHPKYGIITLIELLPKSRCIVQFQSGFIKEVARNTFDYARIKDLYFPSVLGIGVIGDKYKARSGGVDGVEYLHWAGMLTRCHSGRANVGDSYANKTVNTDWLFLTSFGDWCQDQVGFGNPSWQLDKDLLIRGNTEYGPDACVFLPQSINNALPKNMGTTRELPSGVCISWNNKYQVPIEGKTKIFDSPEEAEDAYQSYRRDVINRLREEYKDKIDYRAYIALGSIFE